MAKSKKTTATTETATVINTANNVMDLPRELIVVEKDFNVRSVIDPKAVSEIAKSVKKEGLINPVVVRKRADGKFHLIAGFQRFAAVCGPKESNGLDQPTIRATVLNAGTDDAKDALDDIFTNLAENLARKDLTPYDLAQRCKFLNERYGLSGASIGNRMSLSDSYVNKLIRILRDGTATLIRQWEKECNPTANVTSPVLDVPWMDKLITMSKDQPDPKGWMDTQLRIKMGLEEAQDDDGDDGDGDGDGDAVSVKRATLAQINKAIEAAIEARKGVKNNTEMARFDGMIEALKFCSGDKKTIPGVYNPRKKARANGAATQSN